MSVEVNILDPCTSTEWEQLICDHPDAGVFHHPSWLEMLKDAYGFHIFALCVSRGGSIIAGIPFAEVRDLFGRKRWISLPFSDHCKPLLPPHLPDGKNLLMEYLQKKRKEGIDNIEIRWSLPSSVGTFDRGGYVLHQLRLQNNPDEVFATFRKSTVQRHVRQSQRSGVEIRCCASEEEFMQYYPLQVRTRRRLGVPAQPRSFFKSVWNYMLAPGHGYALLALKKGQAIAGAVFFEFQHTTYYKYGASDYAFRTLNPNHGLMWEAIKRACVKGHSVFDFGRSDEDDAGLRQYKDGWGTTVHELAYTILSPRPPKVGGSLVREFAGKVIRHSPEFVCSMSGELLYKHFA